MKIELCEAVAFYNSLPPSLQYPTINPQFVELDARFSPGRNAFFYLQSRADEFFFSASTQGDAIDGKRDLESQRGYGGPIAKVQSESALQAFSDTYKAFLLEQNVLVEFIRFTPLLNNSDYIATDFLATDRMTVVVPLASESQSVRCHYNSMAKRAVKKSKAQGVTYRFTSDVKDWNAFAQIYSQRMSTLNATAQYLYPNDYFTALAQSTWAGLIVAESNQEIVGGVIYLNHGDYIDYHLSAATPLGFELKVTSLLIDGLVQWGCSAGYKYLNLGGGTDGSADNSLYFFKKSFSKMTADFKIGAIYPDVEKYHALKKQSESGSPNQGRVIYYR